MVQGGNIRSETQSHWVSCKVIQSDSDDDTASSDGDKSDPTDIEAKYDEDLDEVHTTKNYENMKALGDKDCEVLAFYLMMIFYRILPVGRH